MTLARNWAKLAGIHSDSQLLPLTAKYWSYTHTLLSPSLSLSLSLALFLAVSVCWPQKVCEPQKFPYHATATTLKTFSRKRLTKRREFFDGDKLFALILSLWLLPVFILVVVAVASSLLLELPCPHWGALNLCFHLWTRHKSLLCLPLCLSLLLHLAQNLARALAPLLPLSSRNYFGHFGFRFTLFFCSMFFIFFCFPFVFSFRLLLFYFCLSRVLGPKPRGAYEVHFISLGSRFSVLSSQFSVLSFPF